MKRESKSLYALLGVLSLEPQSGYEIKKWIEKSLAHFWQEGYGQIYPNLKRLVHDGLATVYTERQEGKPDKKIYTITTNGRRQLQDWLKSPIQKLPQEKHEILLKLFFGHMVDIDANLAHVTLHQERMSDILQTYRNIEEILRKGERNNPEVAYQLITVRSGILTAEAVIEWCKETIKTLNDLKTADHSENNP